MRVCISTSCHYEFCCDCALGQESTQRGPVRTSTTALTQPAIRSTRSARSEPPSFSEGSSDEADPAAWSVETTHALRRKRSKWRRPYFT
mmetsp:Transcript_33348/g.66395  ORF Transcript_33348/g.66395 Transcript_33348/m.66395 type:complete len:89 (+) Transcript_33348:110-376(+)